MSRMNWEGANRREAERDETSDEYVACSGILRWVGEKSFKIELPRALGQASIPRSLIHAADDGAVDRWSLGEEFPFRLRRWKAEQAGLA